MAVIKVAWQRVRDERWLPNTAAGEMRKMKMYIERRFPGCTAYAVWTRTMNEFKDHPHLVNKAPFLSIKEIRQTLEWCVSPRDQALFWLALLICSRIGNLSGYHVSAIREDEVEVTPIAHKTPKTTRQMTLILYYWNAEMRDAIRKGITPGFLNEEITEPLENLLTKKKVRWHSIRRTAVQVYIDCNVPLANIRAITLHKDDETLLGYVGTIRPIIDKTRPSGMAISHAPFIWRIQNQEERGDVLQMF